MISLLFVLVAAGLLAYANGANDNAKGVATIFGSRMTSYRAAIWWGTLTTLLGSVGSVFAAGALLERFSGKGLVPDEMTVNPDFVLAVVLGAATTVMIAAACGLPISTTHGITGGLIGAGLTAGGGLSLSTLGAGFFLPLAVSPILAAGLGAVSYVAARGVRIGLGIGKDWCICVGETERVVPIPQPASLLAVSLIPIPTVAAAERVKCVERYRGNFFGVSVQRLLDAAHFTSAGSVGFARGLNDTPKMLALLLSIQALGLKAGVITIAAAMAVGGLLSARRVAVTLGEKITPLSPGQGLAANLVTAALVVFASSFGLPVSTTHVSVGSVVGVGLWTGRADLRVVSAIALSWVVTLPMAASLSAGAYWMLAAFG